MNYDTVLREYVLRRIAEIGAADLLIGIPAYNSEETIVGVMSAAYAGLERHYPEARSVLFVSDAGSLDYTRELAQKTKSDKVPKVVAIHRGLSGKGMALRAVFQAAERLGVRAGAVFRAGYEHFAPLWRGVLSAESFAALSDIAALRYPEARFTPDLWSHIVYDFAYSYLRWSRDRYRLVETMTPIYYGRVASFIMETADLTTDEAGEVVERQAEVFEREKAYLLERLGELGDVGQSGLIAPACPGHGSCHILSRGGCDAVCRRQSWGVNRMSVNRMVDTLWKRGGQDRHPR